MIGVPARATITVSPASTARASFDIWVFASWMLTVIAMGRR